MFYVHSIKMDILYFLSFSLHLVFVLGVVEPGPSFPPTKGEIWPKPQNEVKQKFFYSFEPSNFQVQITGQNCSILSNAIKRYSYVYSDLYKIVDHHGRKRRGSHHHSSSLRTSINETNSNRYYKGNLMQLNVDLTSPCEEYPYFGMDESYNLIVSTSSNLVSNSVWGILRGLESFAQLIYITDDYKALRINKTNVVDYPKSSHRGLLLDTSRHFISLENILVMLDGMTMNKMNVFHWHIVDDQSFPYQSDRFPNLSGKGAYHPSMVYTRSDIERVIDYARDRGIRVIPEFDVPGHTRSWGVAFPNILTECYNNGQFIGLGPMNPIKNTTFVLLKELFQEVQDLFKDKYFHVGGDEVQLSCWASNPELLNYMRVHGIHDVKQLHAIFMQNTLPLLTNASKPIVWEEVYSERVPLPQETLVQIWKGQPIRTMVSALRSGYQVLFSSSWYLDHLDNGFKEFYLADPWQEVLDYTNNATLVKGIVGGEACMWGEMVDDRNFLSRIWPRASAAAEKLWSKTDIINTPRSYLSKSSVPKHTMCRIEEHTCRMVRRKVPAQPSGGPGFCVF